MGFAQNWIDRRRRRELERINREIEELKRHGPDFSYREGTKQATTKNRAAAGSSHVGAGFWAGLFAVVLIAFVAYHFISVSSLEKESAASKQEALLLHDRLELALSQLNNTESQLEQKEVVEVNLSTQYRQLQQQIGSLLSEIAQTNSTLAARDDEIHDLNEEVLDLQLYILELGACIKNNTITDKEDCL